MYNPHEKGKKNNITETKCQMAPKLTLHKAKLYYNGTSLQWSPMEQDLVAVLWRGGQFLGMELCHLRPELGGCNNNEVTGLQMTDRPLTIPRFHCTSNTTQHTPKPADWQL